MPLREFRGTSALYLSPPKLKTFIFYFGDSKECSLWNSLE
ncbi:CLUMA_CG004035, isoform A [Clunio marinus]|uniref:CLUMA_CG004035, isoform A n=1 Tax=Clunio marinus TaxID=568069 RepID=A0A1J1HQJ7_9DIPT|nr:CLUMA_CG004035, isoform A [Clunio marinus]